ncbi:MAG: baseplate J/gp47 family protein [Rhizobiaceae bacterium]|nr:baseplate J/gp47 family protein [Rhizobiaceae bacterium]MCC0000971.1 baseplate J/gp47 family protein [Methylobacteriaceae bacterium]
MPSFESPSLYIDFARLPPPDVIETIDFESILDIYHTQLVDRATAAGLPKLVDALKLEQSPTNVILQCQSYGEMIVRARINAAARAVMLPFARKNDLDNLAAFFDVDRLLLSPDTDQSPAVYESDERLLKRIRVACETFSTAGTAGSYIYHALTAVPTLRDVSAIKVSAGVVKVSLVNTGADPTATQAQIDAVYDRLHQTGIKVLTDEVHVASAEILPVDLVANIQLYPGPDRALVLADVQAALTQLRDTTSILGFDLTVSAILAALMQSGVKSVSTNFESDTNLRQDQAVWIRSATITTT